MQPGFLVSLFLKMRTSRSEDQLGLWYVLDPLPVQTPWVFITLANKCDYFYVIDDKVRSERLNARPKSHSQMDLGFKVDLCDGLQSSPGCLSMGLQP